jgi:hypothetical protein
LGPHSNSQTQNHAHVCLRVSVLTGATWIISLVAETASVDWLQAVSFLANGGQGVLLFMSYVATRRVMMGILAARFEVRGGGGDVIVVFLVAAHIYDQRAQQAALNPQSQRNLYLVRRSLSSN